MIQVAGAQWIRRQLSVRARRVNEWVAAAEPQGLHVLRARRVLDASQFSNVMAARKAGVDLAFFSGNEVFWKTRFAPSIDGIQHAQPDAGHLQDDQAGIQSAGWHSRSLRDLDGVMDGSGRGGLRRRHAAKPIDRVDVHRSTAIAAMR